MLISNNRQHLHCEGKWGNSNQLIHKNNKQVTGENMLRIRKKENSYKSRKERVPAYWRLGW